MVAWGIKPGVGRGCCVHENHEYVYRQRDSGSRQGGKGEGQRGVSPVVPFRGAIPFGCLSCEGSVTPERGQLCLPVVPALSTGFSHSSPTLMSTPIITPSERRVPQ